MLVGCSLGRKIVPIANGPELAAIVQAAVEKHGLRERVLPAVTLSPPWHEPAMAAAIGDPKALIAAFSATARGCLEQGAEVIVPAEGVLCAVLSAGNVTEIDGAPVVDVFAAAWLYGVMMVKMQRIFGLRVSDVGTYAQGDRELVGLLLRESAARNASA